MSTQARTRRYSAALTRRYAVSTAHAQPSRDAKTIIGMIHSNTGLLDRMSTRRIWDECAERCKWHYARYANAMHELVTNGWISVKAHGAKLTPKGSDTIMYKQTMVSAYR